MPAKGSKRGRKPRKTTVEDNDSNNNSPPKKKKTEWEEMIENMPKNRKKKLPKGEDRVSVPVVKKISSIAQGRSLVHDSDPIFTSSDEESSVSRPQFPLHAVEINSEEEEDVHNLVSTKLAKSRKRKQPLPSESDYSELPELAIVVPSSQPLQPVSQSSKKRKTDPKTIDFMPKSNLTARQRMYISSSPQRSEVSEVSEVVIDVDKTPHKPKRSHHRSTPISSRKAKSPASLKKTPSKVLREVISQSQYSDTDSTATTPGNKGNIHIYCYKVILMYNFFYLLLILTL